MLTAREAREAAVKSISDDTKEELRIAENCIKNAVNAGETKCWCGRYLHPRALSALRRLGYVVENHSNQRDGNMFLISWGN